MMTPAGNIGHNRFDTIDIFSPFDMMLRMSDEYSDSGRERHARCRSKSQAELGKRE
jgi:hypothetical protein